MGVMTDLNENNQARSHTGESTLFLQVTGLLSQVSILCILAIPWIDRISLFTSRDDDLSCIVPPLPG